MRGGIVEPVIAVEPAGSALRPDGDPFCPVQLAGYFRSNHKRAALTRIKRAGMIAVFCFRPHRTHQHYEFVIRREIVGAEFDSFIAGYTNN